MTLDQVINLLVTVTLVEMMATIGLGVTFAALAAVLRDQWLVVRALLANYVIVPAATVGLLLLFAPHPMVAAGFLILAVCPGAPYGPPFAGVAKGDVPTAVGLMVVLAGSSSVLAPVLLYLLLPLTSGDEKLKVDAVKIVVTLLVTQLLPLAAGVSLRQWRPALAERLRPPATLLSKLLNLAVVGLILYAQFDLLVEIRLRGFVGMTALLLASWGAGWVLGEKEEGRRRTMTLTTALRNVGVGLVIASGAFAGTPTVTATLAYGLFAIVGSLFLALGWGRSERKSEHEKIVTGDGV